ARCGQSGLEARLGCAWPGGRAIDRQPRHGASDPCQQAHSAVGMLGALLMPQSGVTACAVHGLMSLLRLLPAGRALFEDLKVKPQNTFDEGLFWRVRGSERLRGGAVLPEGWVRRATGGGPLLSDDALGLQWALIGFGVDPSDGLP